MRTEAWNRLLDSLIESTLSGRAVWSRSDLPDAFVLGRSSGSVVLRADRYSRSGEASVEIRDESGEVVDELSGNRVFGYSTSGALGMEGLGEPSPAEQTALREKAATLLRLVAERGMAGEQVANRIIDEL
jgi:hypothetical protein